MAERRIKILITKHLNRSLTEVEKQELHDLINPIPGLSNPMDGRDEETLDKTFRRMLTIDMEGISSCTVDLIHRHEATRKRIKWSLAIAGIFILFLICFYLIRLSGSKTPIANQIQRVPSYEKLIIDKVKN